MLKTGQAIAYYTVCRLRTCYRNRRRSFGYFAVNRFHPHICCRRFYSADVWMAESLFDSPDPIKPKFDLPRSQTIAFVGNVFPRISRCRALSALTRRRIDRCPPPTRQSRYSHPTHNRATTERPQSNDLRIRRLQTMISLKINKQNGNGPFNNSPPHLVEYYLRKLKPHIVLGTSTCSRRLYEY